MGKTSIEWANYTFNPWWGCTKVAAGCERCYAEAFAKRTGRAKWGPAGTRTLTSRGNWKKPLAWNVKAETVGENARVFCASMADVFEAWEGPIVDFRGLTELCKCQGCGKVVTYIEHCETPADSAEWHDLCGRLPRRLTLDDVRADLFKLIDATPSLDWLLLTKRPDNIRSMWAPREWDAELWFFEKAEQERRRLVGAGPHKGKQIVSNYPRENVWLGTSIATQADADANLNPLLGCRDLSPILFASIEPLVEEVDLGLRNWSGGSCRDRLDWVIVGGESGPRARPCNLKWIAHIVDDCKAAGVPCFVKQLGANPISPTGFAWNKLDPKGGMFAAFPDYLRVRDFPRQCAEALA